MWHGAWRGAGNGGGPGRWPGSWLRSWRGGRARLAIGGAAAAIVLGPLVWFWQASLLPSTYSVMEMGYPDYGGGGVGASETRSHGDGQRGDGHQGDGHHGGPPPDPGQDREGGEEAGSRSVASLTASDRPADVSVTLVARHQRFQLSSGRTVDGYTVNGESPGPIIRARAGQLVQVRLVNESVPAGITLHWHGVDVPNGADGVAGVTQDAVQVGAEFTYRFVADQVGTFWYHSHQVSHEQVRRGLLGALVVMPAQPPAAEGQSAVTTDNAGRGAALHTSDSVDVVALVHLYGGVRTVNGHEGDLRLAVSPRQRARVRVVNTDNGPMSAWVAGAPYRLVAVDGTDVHEPTPVRDTAVLITAGGRADLEVTMPNDGTPVRVALGGSASIVLGSKSFDAVTTSQPAKTLDLLTYGRPAPLEFDPGLADRTFRYDIGRRPGFLDGRPGMWWTINGHMFPDVPMYVVAEGDVVRMQIANHSGDVHPMHLHGHHAVVLSRNGERATGSPWWVDSLNVGPEESYEVAFIADNPGIWMDHCHNLPHATDGLVAHLMYEGITTPFKVGGGPGNQPE